jgi:hypothetical protein
LHDFGHCLDVHGTAESREAPFLVRMVKLLNPKGEHHIIATRRHHGAGLMQGGGGAGAGVLDVDHRDTSEANRAQDHLPTDTLLAGDEPGSSVANVCRFDGTGLDTGIGHRRMHRLGTQCFQTHIHVLPEPGHANPGDDSVQSHT